jgi:hypothetical protein
MVTAIAEFATTFSVTVAEEMIPGLGFCTTTEMLPTCELVAVPVAVNAVEETRVVVSVALPNCTVAPVAKCAPATFSVKAPTGIDVGVTLVTCGTGLLMVTELAAVFVESAVSTALTVTASPDAGNSGAEYTPVELTVPTEALPPATPFTDQVTAGAIADPVSLALKGCMSFPRSVALAGVTTNWPF